MDKYIKAPIDDEVVNSLKAGDYVYIREQYILPGMQHIKECMRR